MKISNPDGVEFEYPVTVPTATQDGHAISKGQADDAYAPIGGSGTGDVIGPSGATEDNIATFDGATGKLLQDGGSKISDLATAGHDHSSTKLAQANTHESADTDTATTALHHTLGTGANQAAAGNHTHTVGGVVPVGGIIMWSGTVASIPTNWALCDGANSTPDLRDKFVVGAKQDDGGVAKTNITGSLLQSGGDNTHTHSDHSDLTHSGSAVGDHGNHVHSGPADHSSHTHAVTSNVAVAQHDANTTGQASAGATNRGSIASTLTLANHTHSTPVLSHSVTNNQVTSGNESATLTHGNTGNETSTLSHSVTQPSDHDISAHSTSNNIPTFFALAFIMRTA